MNQPAEPTCNAAVQNQAVADCCEAYQQAYKTAIERRKGSINAEAIANEAFKKALPALHGRDNIRNFVACITHGLLMGVFRDIEIARLLYAAQVAQSGAERTAPAKPATPSV